MEIIIAAILFIIIMGAAIIYGALSWGLVVSKFWVWFLLPVFPALPAISFAQAIGLSFFIGLFHTVNTQVIQKEYKDETQGAILAVIAFWITLLVGWIVHSIWF